MAEFADTLACEMPCPDCPIAAFGKSEGGEDAQRAQRVVRYAVISQGAKIIECTVDHPAEFTDTVSAKRITTKVPFGHIAAVALTYIASGCCPNYTVSTIDFLNE